MELKVKLMMIEIKQIQAFETWELRQKVMWADKPIEFVKLPNDDKGFHFGLFKNEQLISVISLFKNGEEGQFRKFATDMNFQGKGYGSELLRHLFSEAKMLNIKYLSCDARTTAIRFYEKLGMKTYSEIFQKNGKDYIKMGINL